MEEAVPRQLPERTGKHYCIRCLAEVPGEAYLLNDHLCDACAEEPAPSAEPSRSDEQK